MKKLKNSLKTARILFARSKIGQKISPYLSPRNRFILGLIAITAIISYLMVVYITIWQYQKFDTTIRFLFTKPEIMIYNTIAMFALTTLIISIIGNWSISVGVIFSVLTGIMYANTEKINSRNTPLLPEDFLMVGEAGALSSMIRMRILAIAIALIMFFIVASMILNKKLKQRYKFRFSKKYTRILRLFLILASSAILVYHTDFLRNQFVGNYMKVDFLNTEINAYNQEENYRINGFIIGTIFNLQPKKMSEPENYSQEEVMKIVEKYTKIAEEKNKDRQDISQEKINIVYVMSESFIDPELARPLSDYGSEDPIPYTRSLMQKYTSGYAASSEYGGGTANVEFEALTGFSNYYLNVIPYSGFVSHIRNFPSFANTLKSNNYNTLALHPFGRTMYKRDTVYPNLGFNAFKSQEHFESTNRIDNSEFISDQSSFEQAIKELKQNDGSSPQFINLVTMQNHMPYKPGLYAQTQFSVGDKAESVSDQNALEIATYLTGLKKSDEALEYFIKEIEQLDQKTIVAFWGDHWPGIYQYDSEIGADKKDNARTPMFIYKNFGNTSRRTDLGTLSLNYLSTTVLDEVNAKLSPFDYMLKDVQVKYPALTRRFVDIDAEDQILKDYQMIQYDILSGRRWSNSNEFFQIK